MKWGQILFKSLRSVPTGIIWTLNATQVFLVLLDITAPVENVYWWGPAMLQINSHRLVRLETNKSSAPNSFQQ